MILGARILSNNLSGKTATVTFMPSTGGTINLGDFVIPFNYFNQNPYGTYELYFSEYDYTYTLTIPAPIVENNQSFVSLSRLSGTTTFGLATLNFSDLTAEMVSLDISSDDWNEDYFWVTNESGYIVMFTSDNDYNDKLVVFVDKFSNEIGRYSAYTTNLNYYSMDRFGLTLIDYDNGKVVYTDGTNLRYFDYDNVNQSCQVIDEYDQNTENRSILLKVDTYSATTYTIYLLNSSGVTVVDEYDYNQYNKIYSTYKTGSFILNYNYDYGTGYYTDINIYDQDGVTVLDTFTLSANTYDYQPYYSFFGKNKLIIYFYNPFDDNIPYTFYYYNGDTDSSDSLIKERGSNFYNFQVFTSRPYDWNVDRDFGSLIMEFWDTSYGYSSTSGDTIGYLDIVSIIDGSDTFSTYNYQNSGLPDKSFNLYQGWLLKTFYSWGNTGDGQYSIIAVGPSGVTYIPVQSFPFNKPLDTWGFGDNIMQAIWEDNYTGGTFNLFNNNSLVDSMFFNRPDGWQYGYQHNIFYLTNYVDMYYVNNSTSGFTSIEYYDNINNPWYYWTDSGYNEGVYVMLNTTNGKTAIITEDNYITGSTLPTNGGDYDILVGKSNFMYIYNLPTWEGNIVIELYDFNFNLLNSIQTEYDGWNNTYAMKDRYVVQFNNNNSTQSTYLISESVIDFVTTDSYNYTQINDYFWD